MVYFFRALSPFLLPGYKPESRYDSAEQANITDRIKAPYHKSKSCEQARLFGGTIRQGPFRAKPSIQGLASAFKDFFYLYRLDHYYVLYSNTKVFTTATSQSTRCNIVLITFSNFQ